MIPKQGHMFLCFMSVAFLAGMVSGLLIADKRASAAEKFGPDIVKTEASKSFIEGGDRNYGLLKEIQALVDANAKHLQALESLAKSIDTSVQTIPGKLDVTNGHLASIQRRETGQRP